MHMASLDTSWVNCASDGGRVVLNARFGSVESQMTRLGTRFWNVDFLFYTHGRREGAGKQTHSATLATPFTLPSCGGTAHTWWRYSPATTLQTSHKVPR